MIYIIREAFSRASLPHATYFWNKNGKNYCYAVVAFNSSRQLSIMLSINAKEEGIKVKSANSGCCGTQASTLPGI
jgi:uncharacterized protein YpmB